MACAVRVSARKCAGHERERTDGADEGECCGHFSRKDVLVMAARLATLGAASQTTRVLPGGKESRARALDWTKRAILFTLPPPDDDDGLFLILFPLLTPPPRRKCKDSLRTNKLAFTGWIPVLSFSVFLMFWHQN